MISISVSFILGALGAWIISRYAPMLGLVNIPSERSSHTRPTPTGGGLGILFAVVLVCIIQNISAAFWMSAVLLSFYSLLGDWLELSVLSRLIVQFAAAISFLIGLNVVLPFDHFSYDPGTWAMFFNAAALSIYIVGTANFYNFMDGIDGISSITGIVGFGLVGCYGLAGHQNPAWITLSFSIAAACAGFLPFHILRARIFMGDVGSILLGFAFACLAVSFSESVSDFMTLLCFMFPFYMDALISLLERIYDRQNIFQPHRRHLYQVLGNEGGIPQWKVSVGYGFLQLTVGLFAWFAFQTDMLVGIIGITFLTSIFFLLNVRAKKRLLYQREG